jgi:hypothetical protein
VRTVSEKGAVLMEMATATAAAAVVDNEMRGGGHWMWRTMFA